MENNITVTEDLQKTMTLGDVFVKSGLFPDIKSQAQAVVKILAGKEIGVAPLEAMMNIYIVNGKIAVQAKLIAALIKRSKKYDYTVDKQDEKECAITFHQYNASGEQRALGTSTFTWQDAIKAGLVNKQVWKDYPKNMLFARAMSNGARFYCPDVFSGYTPEELGDASPVEVLPEKKTIVIDGGEAKVEEKT